jgi:hypothetical protein
MMTRAVWIGLLATFGSLGLALLAGFAGAVNAVPMPLLAARVWGGVTVLLAIYLGMPSRRRWIIALEPAWITAGHAWRFALGVYVLALVQNGELPGGFALTGGIAEAIVGASAPLAGFWLGAGTRRRRTLLTLWHVLSLAALLHMMGVGIALHLSGDRLIDSMARFPLFLLPLFAIPLTLAAHLLTLFALAFPGNR